MNRSLKYQIDLNNGTFGQGMDKALQQTQALDNAVGKVGAALGIAFTVDKFRDLAERTTDVYSKMQAYDNVLKFASKDSEDFGRNQKFLSGIVDDLKLPIMETSEGFSKLLGAMRGTALEGEGARKIFKGASEAVTALHLDAATANSVFYAMQNIMSKGTLQAQELTLQLGNALPGAQKLAADAMGLTTQELVKQMEQGKIMAEDFLPKFAAEMDRVYGPQMGTAVESVTAKLNDANNAIIKQETALGEKLNPVWIKYLELQGWGLTKVSESIDFLKQHEQAIQVLAYAVGIGTTAWVLNTAALKLNVWWNGMSKLALIANAIAIDGVRGAMIALNYTAAINPFVVFIAALGTALLAADKLVDKMLELNDAQKKAMNYDQDLANKMQLKLLARDYAKNGMSEADAKALVIKDETNALNKKIDLLEKTQLKYYGKEDMGVLKALENNKQGLIRQRDNLGSVFGDSSTPPPAGSPPPTIAGKGAGKAAVQSVPGGSSVRNVTVTIQNLVNGLNYKGSPKDNERDLEKEMTEILIRTIRNSEMAL